jgi:hypothetical protein
VIVTAPTGRFFIVRTVVELGATSNDCVTVVAPTL